MAARGRRLTLLRLSCLVGLLGTLAACDQGATGGGSFSAPVVRATASAVPQATPTPLPIATVDPALSSPSTDPPVIPPIHTLALGTFLARYITPMTAGIVLYGAPAGTDPQNVAGDTTLSFYDFATGTIRQIASATPGSNHVVRGIVASTAGGDWLVYVQNDQNGQDWAVQAVNVVTGTNLLIDSEEQESGGALGNVATNGIDVVWSGGDVTQRNWYLRELHLTTGAVRPLVTSTDHQFRSLLLSGNVLFFQEPAQSSATSWLWRLDQPAPVQIPVTAGLNASFNGNYVVWDTYGSPTDPKLMKLSLYNIVTGQITDPWGPACIRPGVAPDRPYVMCLDDFAQSWVLVRVPSGASTAFAIGVANGGEWGHIVNGRIYWIPTPDKSTIANNVIKYFDVPTS